MLLLCVLAKLEKQLVCYINASQRIDIWCLADVCSSFRELLKAAVLQAVALLWSPNRPFFFFFSSLEQSTRIYTQLDRKT